MPRWKRRVCCPVLSLCCINEHCLPVITTRPVINMAPRINDVATSLTDPPQFVAKPSLNPLPETFKPKFKEAYASQLRALRASCSRQEAFDACKKAASEMPRWTIEKEDAASGLLEGHAATKILRFKDDFVIRVADEAGGRVRIDMRSKSRLGKSDFGANAARTSEFMQRVKESGSLQAEWVPLE
jgi:uncharacterized protein (DUF1499 family)